MNLLRFAASALPDFNAFSARFSYLAIASEMFSFLSRLFLLCKLERLSRRAI